MENEEIITRLKKYQEDNSLTQEGLAQKIGTTVATLNRWLNGRHKISKAYIYALQKKGMV